MSLLKTLILYLETIVNVFSNALVQTFLVYTTVVLIYKIWIEEQTTNYIPIFVTDILSKLKNTYNEIDYGREQYGNMNRTELETKYQSVEVQESEIHKVNKEHNRQVIFNALKMSVGILVVFVLFTLITSHFSVHIHWYQLFLSAAITVVGTSYEYFFITQIAVKYHYIKLTQLYDSMVDKIEVISDGIVKSDMVADLEQIVENSGLNNNASISDYLPSDMLQNAIKNKAQNNITDRVTNVIGSVMGNNNNADNGNVNNGNVNNGENLEYKSNRINNNNITMNNILKQIGNSMNDTEHEAIKNNVV